MTQSEPETLVDLLKQVAAASPDQEVMKFKEGKRWSGMTGGRLLERVRCVALGLYGLGVRKGDTVAILAESSPLWTIADFAILSLGAVNVPIYPTQSVPQVEYIIQQSRPKLLFISSAKQLKRISAALELFPDLPVVPFQPVPLRARGIEFKELEERGAASLLKDPAALDRLSSGVTGSDLASIIYTSGTTGEPKGVMLTHSNIVFDAIAAGTFLKIEAGNQMLSFLPLSHVFERTVVYLCLHFRVNVAYAGGLETVATDLQAIQPTLMSTVPRMLERTYGRILKNVGSSSPLKQRLFRWGLKVGRCRAQSLLTGGSTGPLLNLQCALADRLMFAKIRQVLGGRIRRMVSGGAALPADIALNFNGMGVPVLQGYGMTETSPVIAVNTLEENRIGTVGKPLPGVQVKIADDGEILTCGPHVFKGYFEKPEETREAFVDGEPGPGSWLKTGDIGYFDKDGFLVITDRKKDLIKTSAGKYIAPQMIEGRIGQSEYIEQACVVGNNRKYVSALIVPDFERLSEWAGKRGIEYTGRDELIRDDRVLDLIRSEVGRLTADLADYEKVKRLALLPTEFTIESGELTPTLKARRRVIEEKYKDIIESLYPDGNER
jgi:long-chain acyl-CoA synthetase